MGAFDNLNDIITSILGLPKLVLNFSVYWGSKLFSVTPWYVWVGLGIIVGLFAFLLILWFYLHREDWKGVYRY